MGGAVRVLISDQRAVIRAGLRALLAPVSGIEVVGEVSEGRATVEAARQLRPDVLLTEVRPGATAVLEVSRLLASPALLDRTAVVVMADVDAVECAIEALRAGASGAVAKDAPLEHVVTAVRVAAQRGIFVTASVLERLMERRAPVSSAAAALRLLSARELAVLRLIARGLSNAEIAGRLRLAEPTVKTHVRHLFRKLHVRNRAEAATLASRSGLDIGEEPVAVRVDAAG